MEAMFQGCQSIKELNLSNFKTNSVTIMSYMFRNCNELNKIIMNNSDIKSVDAVINQLPTRTTLGHMYISRDILSDVNVDGAESKMWKISSLSGTIKNVYVNGNNIINMFASQNKKIKGIYLGNDSLL
jgi:surface protein